MAKHDEIQKMPNMLQIQRASYDTFLETGLLNSKFDEILLYRVRDISLTISLGQRLFGTGTINATKAVTSFEK